MFTFVLIILFGQTVSAAEVKPVIGVLPFDLPEDLRAEIGENMLYVSASTTKWMEMFHTRWAPIDPDAKDFLSDLEHLNGVLIMGEQEEWNLPNKLHKYEVKLQKVIAAAADINKKRYFPIIGIGFGAQLLFKQLAKGDFKVISSAHKNQFLDYEFTDEKSSFTGYFQNVQERFNGKYPNHGEWFVGADEISPGKELAQHFTLIAKTKLKEEGKEVIAFYEYKPFPVFGLMSDYQSVHFAHGLINHEGASEQQLNIGLLLSEFWASQLKKSNVTADQKWVNQSKKGWKRHASVKHPEQFEEIFVHDL